MPKKERSGADRTARAVTQKLESLHRSGVTHLRRAKAPAVAASKARAASASAAPSTPAAATPAPAKSRAAETPVAAKAPAAKTLQPKPAVGTAASSAGAAAASSDTKPVAPADRPAALARVAADVARCIRCLELAQTRTQTVFGSGNPNSKLVFMGEAPGADEDKQGLPFVGRAGQLLTDMIVKGMKLRREDVYILNTLKCRPPGNRTPLPSEAENCRGFLDRQLAIIRPEFICCLGAVAAQNLLNVGTPIGQLRGRFHDLNGIKVLCTYHPAYVLRNPAAKRPVWEDLQLLMSEMGLPISGM